MLSFQPFTNLSLLSLLLRLAIGGSMLTHGITKITSFSTLSTQFPDPIGVGSHWALLMAIAGEVGCSLLLIIGLGTRFALLPLIFIMLTATFVVHGSDPFATRELSILYILVYLAIFGIGAGKYSMDNLLLKR